MVNGIRASYSRGLNKRRGLKSRVGSRVWYETPEEGWRIYRPKRCEYDNKDEDNSPKTLNDKNHQASSQKFTQLSIIYKNISTITVNSNYCCNSQKCKIREALKVLNPTKKRGDFLKNLLFWKGHWNFKNNVLSVFYQGINMRNSI